MIVKLCYVVLSAFLILFLGNLAHAQHDDETDHGHEHGGDDHEGGEMEMRRIYRGTTDNVTLIWTQASSDDNLELYFLEVGDGTTCGDEQLEEAAAQLEGMTESDHLHIGDAITPPALIDVHITGDATVAAFPVRFPSDKCIAVFCPHTAEEKGLIFLNLATSQELQIAFEEELHEEQLKYSAASVAGSAIGGSIVVSLLPLVFTLLLYPLGLLRKTHNHLKTVFNFLNAFGCGSLLAVVTLHLYPEMVEQTLEAGLSFWQGGSLVLAGICIIAVIHLIADGVSHRKHETTASVEEKVGTENANANNPDATKDSEEQNTSDSFSVDSKYLRWGTCRDLVDFKSLHPLVWGITIGDAMHNFVDGTIIAAGFMACGPSTGWTTVAAIIAHELPQELGDISVMLAKGSTIGQALVFNLVSQATGIIGCAIVLGIGDSLPARDLGLLIAFGVGTFLFIALTDMMPMLLEARQTRDYVVISFGLVLAFTAIGLSLMGSEGSCGGHRHSH